MKNRISRVLLTLLLVFSVLTPINVFAATGDYQLHYFDVNNVEIPSYYIETPDYSTAVAPYVPVIEGKTNARWVLTSTADSGKTLNFTATYDTAYFSVMFIDENNAFLKTITNVQYGTGVTAPDTSSIANFIKWNRDITSIKENLTIKPITKTPNFTVTFLDGANKPFDVQTVESGKNVDVTTRVPTLSGKTFRGWVESTSNIKADTTVHPLFSDATQDKIITFYDWQGNIMAKQGYAVNDLITAPVVPTWDSAHTFAGWSLNTSEDILDLNTYKVTASASLRVRYSGYHYVTYLDASNNVLDVQCVYHGADAYPPTAPAKTGYVFDKWSSESTGVTKDLTIIPIYKVDPGVTYYTVKFMDIDGKLLSTQIIASGDAAVPPTAPAITGKTFTNWDKDYSKITTDLVLNPVYSDVAATYKTVTFKNYDGATLKVEQVAVGGSATAPANPTRSGYTFKGWDVSFNNITVDTTVTATYKKKTTSSSDDYTVTFVDWDGTEIDSQSVAEGDDADPPAEPTREGYKFTGWSVSLKNITADKTAKALYTANSTTATGATGTTNTGNGTSGSTAGKVITIEDPVSTIDTTTPVITGSGAGGAMVTGPTIAGKSDLDKAGAPPVIQEKSVSSTATAKPSTGATTSLPTPAPSTQSSSSSYTSKAPVNTTPKVTSTPSTGGSTNGSKTAESGKGSSVNEFISSNKSTVAPQPQTAQPKLVNNGAATASDGSPIQITKVDDASADVVKDLTKGKTETTSKSKGGVGSLNGSTKSDTGSKVYDKSGTELTVYDCYGNPYENFKPGMPVYDTSGKGLDSYDSKGTLVSNAKDADNIVKVTPYGKNGAEMQIYDKHGNALKKYVIGTQVYDQKGKPLKVYNKSGKEATAADGGFSINSDNLPFVVGIPVFLLSAGGIVYLQFFRK